MPRKESKEEEKAEDGISPKKDNSKKTKEKKIIHVT